MKSPEIVRLPNGRRGLLATGEKAHVLIRPEGSHLAYEVILPGSGREGAVRSGMTVLSDVMLDAEPKLQQALLDFPFAEEAVADAVEEAVTPEEEPPPVEVQTIEEELPDALRAALDETGLGAVRPVTPASLEEEDGDDSPPNVEEEQASDDEADEGKDSSEESSSVEPTPADPAPEADASEEDGDDMKKKEGA